MRVKLIIPDGEDFDGVVAEVRRFGSIYVKSKRRRFIAVDEPPAQARDNFLARGIKIVADRQYNIE